MVINKFAIFSEKFDKVIGGRTGRQTNISTFCTFWTTYFIQTFKLWNFKTGCHLCRQLFTLVMEVKPIKMLENFLLLFLKEENFYYESSSKFSMVHR